MKILLIILLASMSVQESENFGLFYYKNFETDKDFKITRIKYPLTLTGMHNKIITFDKWEEGIDTLTISSEREVFVHQPNLTLVVWDKKDCKIQNEFTRLEGRWFLTGIKLSPR